MSPVMSLLISALFPLYSSYSLHVNLWPASNQGVWEDHIFSYVMTVEPEFFSFF